MVLEPNTQIRFRRQNAAFYNDFLPKDFSFTFKLPIRGNAMHLDYVHRLDTYAHPNKLPITLEMAGGVFSFQGYLKLTGSDNSHYIAQLEVLPNAFNGDLMLGELNLPNFFKTLDTGAPGLINSLTWPNIDYCFPMFRLDDVDFAAKYLWPWVNRHNAGSFQLTSGSGKVPMNVSLYLPEVLKQICKSFGYSIKGDFFRHIELTKLCIWNNYILAWNGGNIDIPMKHLLPQISLREFLMATRNILGLNIQIDDSNKTVFFDFLKDLPFGKKVRDLTQLTEKTRQISFESINGISISQTFDDRDGYPSEAIKEVDRNNITGTVDYYGDLPALGPYVLPFEEGQVYYTRLENAYYVLEASGRKFLSYDHQDYQEPNQELGFSSQASPLIEHFEAIPASTSFSYGTLLPKVIHKHSDNASQNSFGYRLFFYRGYQPDGGGYNYPLATGYNRKVKTAPPYWEQLGNLSLHPNQDAGTYNQLIKPWHLFMKQSKVIKATINLKGNDISFFKPTELIKYQNEHYIWKSFDYILGSKGIMPSEAELVKV